LSDGLVKTKEQPLVKPTKEQPKEKQQFYEIDSEAALIFGQFHLIASLGYQQHFGLQPPLCPTSVWI
jgi:hypothetical protein